MEVHTNYTESARSTENYGDYIVKVTRKHTVSVRTNSNAHPT